MTVQRSGLLVLLLSIVAAGCAKQATNFAELSTPAQLSEIRGELETAKTAIAAGGDHYHCCIDPTCNWCALHMASCECGHSLAEGKPVCPECVLGWRKGKGDMADINAAGVKSALTEGTSHDDEEAGGHDEHPDHH